MDFGEAQSVFGANAREYALHRPGYPPEAVVWAIGLDHPARVLDLGAGTGKLTAALLAAGHEVVAVEPDPAMLAELSAAHAGVPALVGSAERIPLPDADVDAVLAGQVLHWVDGERAYPEVARVLRPGGAVAGLWNSDELQWIAQVLHGEDAAGEEVRWEGYFPDRQFTDESHRSFANPRRHTVDSLVSTIATYSALLRLPEPERARRLASTRAALTDALGADREFEVPSRTHVIRARKR